jgi:hypothetical protein
MDNPEKPGNTVYTRQRKTKQKYNTICVGHHYTQTNTINVNKTWALLQTSGGKDEPNIIYLEIVADNTHGTQDVKKHNMTTQKTKKMSNTDTTIKLGGEDELSCSQYFSRSTKHKFYYRKVRISISCFIHVTQNIYLSIEQTIIYNSICFCSWFWLLNQMKNKKYNIVGKFSQSIEKS